MMKSGKAAAGLLRTCLRLDWTVKRAATGGRAVSKSGWCRGVFALALNGNRDKVESHTAGLQHQKTSQELLQFRCGVGANLKERRQDGEVTI